MKSKIHLLIRRGGRMIIVKPPLSYDESNRWYQDSKKSNQISKSRKNKLSCLMLDESRKR